LSLRNIFNRKRYWVIHSSALKTGRVSKIFENNIIEGVPLVSKKELDGNNTPAEKKIMEKELKNLKGFGLIISDYDFIPLISRYKANAIIDNDKIGKRLNIRNIKYLDISKILMTLKKDYSPGEKILARIVYKNVGYTNDCTKVIVKDGIFKENEIVECWVTQLIDGPLTKTLFCKKNRKNG